MDSERSQQNEVLDNIYIEDFKAEHLPALISMLEDQGSDDIDDHTMVKLPKIGYMAFIDEEPIAAGFLRQVEGNIVAQIDNLTTNPYFGSEIRHQALCMVLNQLVEDAKSLKVKGIISFTLDKSIIMRAEAMGFHLAGHSIIALRLS